VLALAGCGGGSPSLTVPPARQYTLAMHVAGTAAAGRPATVSFSVRQPGGSTLAQFRHGAGPHRGVHVIYVRSDLGAIVHHHPAIAANGTFVDRVCFPSGGRYRVVVDVYPRQTAPQPNFKLFMSVLVRGAHTATRLPPPVGTELVDGYRFTLHGRPQLHAILPPFLSFTVTAPDGTAARFRPPGKLAVGVLVPVPGTWRLFLQCRVDGHVLTAPFTLRVR
jgi:hypothetical protein